MNKKIIILLAIILIAVILSAGYYFLNANSQTQPKAGTVLKQTNTQNQNGFTPAVILLSTSKPDVKVGETFTVSINISSRSATDGTDIIILYDPQLLAVESNAEKAVTVGTMYPEYPINLDNKAGQIKVSGISPSSEGVVASGLFGTIKFKALKKGTASINLDFKKDSTTDSNVIESSSKKDILEAVQNTQVLID